MKTKTLIISTRTGFELYSTFEEHVANVEHNIVAVYDDEDEAKAGLARAKAIEETIRPMWLAALQHANKLEAIMLDIVWNALAKEADAG